MGGRDYPGAIHHTFVFPWQGRQCKPTAMQEEELAAWLFSKTPQSIVTAISHSSWKDFLSHPDAVSHNTLLRILQNKLKFFLLKRGRVQLLCYRDHEIRIYLKTNKDSFWPFTLIITNPCGGILTSDVPKWQQSEASRLKLTPDSEQHCKTRWLTIQGSASFKAINLNKKQRNPTIPLHLLSFEKPY